MSAQFHNDWIGRKARVMYQGATPPDATKFQLCLADTASLSRSSPLSAFITAELVSQYGYQRKNVVWTESGNFSNTNLRYELPLVEANYLAAGGAIQFQTAFLLADAHAKAQETFAPDAIDTTANTITIASNLLANGDAVSFEALPGGTLPNGLPTLTTCYAISVNNTTGLFQVSATSGGAPLVISNAGSGTFRMRYATGSIVLLQIEADPVIIQDSKPNVYELALVELNTVYGAGV